MPTSHTPTTSTPTSTTTDTAPDRGAATGAADLLLADGGLETTLVFHEGIELPDFAAFVLLASDAGRAALRRYYEPYLQLAAEAGLGMVLDTPTWRANADWGVRQGLDAAALAAVNRDAVDFVAGLAAEHPTVAVVVNGVLGPRGDGYVVDGTMSADDATEYHLLQARAFADAGVDTMTAVTMTYVDEAIGIVRAADAVGLPAAVSFTVETDGRLPSGDRLGDAIEAVDTATGGAPTHYMINCAHPTHFVDVLAAGGDWLRRVQAVRANASRLSHAELDAAPTLDRGDVADLAARYRDLRAMLPALRIVGGCCGTDHHHIAAIAAALAAP